MNRNELIIQQALQMSRGKCDVVPYGESIDMGDVAPCSETIDFHGVCAVYDRNFVMHFSRRQSGLFERDSDEKVGCADYDRSSSGVLLPQTVPFSEIANGQFHCSWCGNRIIHRCGGCHALVCGGRRHGKTFVCRESCGNEGIVGNALKSIDGWVTDEDPIMPSPRAPKARLLLGPGTALVRRG